MSVESSSKANKRTKFFWFKRVSGALAAAIILGATFLGGYALVSDKPLVQACQAAAGDPILPDYPPIPGEVSAVVNAAGGMVIDGFCPCLLALGLPPPSLCDFRGETKLMMKLLETQLRLKLASTAAALEAYIGDWLVDGMVATMLQVLNQAELNLIDWWDTFWFYNLNPALQDMTKQFSVGLLDQTRMIHSGLDGQQAGETVAKRQFHDVEAKKEYQPTETAAVAATMAGGQMKAEAISAGMRSALQNDYYATGINRKTTYDGTPNPAALGVAAAQAARRKIFKDTFCDPDGNNGNNLCGSSNSKYHNIDVQPTKQIFSRLTIDILGTSGKPNETAAVEEPGFFKAPLFIHAAKAAAPLSGGATLQTTTDPDPTTAGNAVPETVLIALRDNICGFTDSNPIPKQALSSAQGRELYLRRRTDLTRSAALCLTLNDSIGRRMPGSGLGQWVGEVREAAGVPAGQISPNPSQLEAWVAECHDSQNSGNFAADQLGDRNKSRVALLKERVCYLKMLWYRLQLQKRQEIVLATRLGMKAEKAQDRLVPYVRQLQSRQLQSN